MIEEKTRITITREDWRKLATPKRIKDAKLKNIKMKLDNNVKVGIDIIGITTYSYLLSKCLNIYYPQSIIYSFLLIQTSDGTIDKNETRILEPNS